MSYIAYNVYLTVTGSTTGGGPPQIITLNGLSNGYYAPPSNGSGNPPVVMQFIQVADCATPVAIVQSYGLVENSDMGYYYDFGDVVSYNLPDGSLLTFGFMIKPGSDQEVTVTLPNVPTTSTGSLYAVSYDPDYQTSLNLTLSLVN